MHEGKLNPEARARRAVKNARWAARRGEPKAVGSSHRTGRRLFRFGNRQARGVGR